MGLPGHRRTSSDKRRRASHFALKATPLTTDASGKLHRQHRVAPGATEYNGKAIHVKPSKRKAEKAAKRLAEKTPKKKA
jgi:ribosomal protein L32